MGLIAAPDVEDPKQLESGDDDDDAADSAGASEASDGAAARPATPSKPKEEPVVHEAQLIEEFDKLEKSD